MSKEGISVVIPAYNEEHAITDTVRRVFSVCQKMQKPFEVIVVDDGSRDGSGEAARSAGASVIVNPANGGYGISLQRGIKAARYDLIAITDADGTYPVEDLPKLLDAVERGVDMAVGARQGETYEGSAIKSFSRKVFKWLAEYVAGRHIPDINSGLRAFRRDLALTHLPETCFGFSFTTSLTLIFMLKGYFVTYLPIAYHARIGKSKVRHVRDALRTLQVMTEIIIRYNPLKLFLLLALAGSLFGILVGFLGFLSGNDAMFLAGWVFLASSLIVSALGCLAQRIENA